MPTFLLLIKISSGPDESCDSDHLYGFSGGLLCCGSYLSIVDQEEIGLTSKPSDCAEDNTVPCPKLNDERLCDEVFPSKLIFPGLSEPKV